jgi:hypothetical protein
MNIYLPTRKLKSKQRKTSKNNKMKRGGMDQITGSKRKLEEQPLKRSARLTGNPSLFVNRVVIGNGDTSSSSYGKNIYTPTQIETFVINAITDGYQIVSLPTTPESHSIIVIVGDHEIKIIDWINSDDENTTNDGYDWGKEWLEFDITKREKILQKFKSSSKLTTPEKNYIKWHQYAILIDEIKSKYPGHTLIFEGVDKKEDIYKKTKEKHTTCRMGGCSEYVHLWLAKKGDSEGFSPLQIEKTY